MLYRFLKKGVDMATVLRDYTYWPRGLAILLQAGHKISPGIINAAWRANDVATFQLLFESRNLHPGCGDIHTISHPRHPNNEIRKIIVKALALRRRQLHDLALTHLPSETVSRLQIKSNSLLGFDSAEAYLLLKKQDLVIDMTEEEHGWLIYEAVGSDVQLADLLWDAGFRDVDDLNDVGETALMRLGNHDFQNPEEPLPLGILEMAEWLISKGANINHMKSDSPALHYLGYSVGSDTQLVSPWIKSDQFSQVSKSCKILMLKIFLNSAQDTCCCFCSPVGGCSALTRYLDGLFPVRSTISHPFEKQFSALVRMLQYFTIWLNPSYRQFFEDTVASQILRFLTFRILDITHTCAHNRHSAGQSSLMLESIDPEEVREIYEEEDLLIQELEYLASELLSEWKASKISFVEFLSKNWARHMDEVLPAKASLSDEELSRIRNIGVVLNNYPVY
jgi:hypothetical protein